MTTNAVKSFKHLLKNYLAPTDEISAEDITNLTQPGENYCSDIYRVDMVLRNVQNGSETRLHIVAKCMKENCSGSLKTLITCHFNKEFWFYYDIVESLRHFQQKTGVNIEVDLFPKMLAFDRSETEVNGQVNANVIILENLKMKGYSNIDRCLGFNLEGAKMVLQDLAAFHAVPLALKLKNPEVFDQKIKKHCIPPKFVEGMNLKTVSSKAWVDAILNQEQCQPYRDLLEKKLESQFYSMDTFSTRPAREPYGTIIHFDMWTNNTMQIVENGRFIKNKFVDFQVYLYGSPLCDLILFIWSSIQFPVIENYYVELIRHYHHHFVRILDEFGCDTTPFEYDSFLKEIDEVAPYELLHILFLIAVIYVDKGEKAIDFSKDLDEFMSESIPDMTAERIARVVVEFGKRGWIQI